MFVLNIKFNKKVFIKVFTIVVIILVTTLFIFTIKKVIIPASKNKMLKMNVNANVIEESNQKNKHNASRRNNNNNNSDNNNNNNNNNNNSSSNNNINEYHNSQCDNDINQNDISNNKSNNKILEINSNNFTTFLKNCNENIDSYVGKTVHISSDFAQNQFVVARLMPIHYENASNKKSNFMTKLELDGNSALALYGEADLKLNYKSNLISNLNQKISKQTLVNQNANDNCVVVGILCEGNTLSDFKSNSWVDITGKIEAGNYKGKIPIINVNSVKQIESKPNELFVEQPQ